MEYLADLEELIAGYLADQQLIGVGLALIQDGEIVHLGGYGRTRLDSAGVPVTEDTLLAYGSVCKTICATLIMRLVERGVLALDAPLHIYLPRLRFSDPELGQKITLRHVLSHTTGLPMWGRSWGPPGIEALSETLHAEIPHYHFLAPPGTFHLYSNVVFCLAGAAAEAAMGRPYSGLVEEFVFRPLAMRHSTFDLAEAITRPVALPYRRNDGRPELRSRLTHNDAGLPSSFGYGSTLDLAQLACAFLNQGRVAGEHFLATESVAEMQRTHAGLHITAAAHPFARIYDGYGLGIQTGRYRGQRVARHGGVTPGYQVFFELFPDAGCAAIVQATYLGEEAVMEMVGAAWDTVLGHPPGGMRFAPAPEILERSELELATHAGTYQNVERGDLAEFSWDGGRLHLTWRGQTDPLTPTVAGELYAHQSRNVRVPVYFLPPEEGVTPTALIFRQPYQRVVAQPGPAPAAWERLTGRYRDPFNLDPAERVTVSIADEQLLLSEAGRSAPLRPLGPTIFLSPLGTIDFPPQNGAPAGWLQIGKAARYYRVP